MFLKKSMYSGLLAKNLGVTFLVTCVLFGVTVIAAWIQAPPESFFGILLLFPLSLLIVPLYYLWFFTIALSIVLAFSLVNMATAWALNYLRVPCQVKAALNVVAGAVVVFIADYAVLQGMVFKNPDSVKDWVEIVVVLLGAVVLSGTASMTFHKALPIKLRGKTTPEPKPEVTAVPEGVSREQIGNGFFSKTLWKIVLPMAVTVVLLTLVAGFTSPVPPGFSGRLSEGSPDNVRMLFGAVGYGASQLVLRFFVLGICGAVVTGVLLALAYGQIKARVPVTLSLAVGLVVSSIPGGLVFWYTRGWLQPSIEYAEFYSLGSSFAVVTVGIMTAGGATVFLTAYCALKKALLRLPDAPLMTLLGMRQEFHRGPFEYRHRGGIL